MNCELRANIAMSDIMSFFLTMHFEKCVLIFVFILICVVFRCIILLKSVKSTHRII